MCGYMHMLNAFIMLGVGTRIYPIGIFRLWQHTSKYGPWISLPEYPLVSFLKTWTFQLVGFMKHYQIILSHLWFLLFLQLLNPYFFGIQLPWDPIIAYTFNLMSLDLSLSYYSCSLFSMTHFHLWISILNIKSLY